MQNAIIPKITPTLNRPQ